MAPSPQVSRRYAQVVHTRRAFEIQSLDDLRAASRNPAVIGLFSHARVRLALQGVPQPTLEGWESRLNRHLADCGCEVGAGAALATLSAVLLIGGRGLDLLSLQFAGVAFLSVGLALPAAAIGKLAGLWLAKRRFSRATHALLTDDRLSPLALADKG